jgi:hypothetical protein
MKSILSLLLILCVIGSTYAQDIDSTHSHIRAQPGTYQVRLSPSKFEYVYTEETLVYFEANRKEDEDVVLHINQFVTVFIPSRIKISSPSYKPLAEIIYQ